MTDCKLKLNVLRMPMCAGGEIDGPTVSSSFLDILSPNATSLAQDLLYQSWGGRPPAAEPRDPVASEYEFLDAESVLGSFQSGLTSFMSATASGLRGYEPIGVSGAGIRGAAHDISSQIFLILM